MSGQSGTEAYSHDGDRSAVLLLHGFTGSPASLRPWAQALADRGLTVRLPLLPGHGTSWQDLQRTTWHDWYETAAGELVALVESGHRVVVGGLSMGGALALRVAELRQADVAGLVLVNPAVRLDDPRLRLLPVLSRVRASIPGIGNDIAKPGQDELAYDRTPLRALRSQTHLWRDTVRDLPRVTQPLLLLRSAVDHVVPATSSETVLRRVGSHDVTEVVLRDSYHVATLDHDADVIVTRSADFVARVTAEGEA